MKVNLNRNIINAQGMRFFAAAIACVFVGLCLVAFVPKRPDAQLVSKKLNLAVRAIGHQVLLQSGDSTSIVRPVIQKSEGVFVLEFGNEFSFKPDSLVAIAQRVLDKTGLAHYTVTVHECKRAKIVYGFEINPPDNSVPACLGRTQPKACYSIEVAFADFPEDDLIASSNIWLITAVVSVFAFVLIGRNVFARNAKTQEQKDFQEKNSDTVTNLGQFYFDPTRQTLSMRGEIISLTDKESKILFLLNKNSGQLTSREELIEEVWTNEGVITGRSLDMFISKLRKKISADPDLRITNVHGKGYRLEVLQP